MSKMTRAVLVPAGCMAAGILLWTLYGWHLVEEAFQVTLSGKISPLYPLEFLAQDYAKTPPLKRFWAGLFFGVPIGHGMGMLIGIGLLLTGRRGPSLPLRLAALAVLGGGLFLLMTRCSPLHSQWDAAGIAVCLLSPPLIYMTGHFLSTSMRP
jgi:hypothetical protein